MLFDMSLNFSDFYNPLQEDELDQSTVVDLLFPIDPKPVSVCLLLYPTTKNKPMLSLCLVYWVLAVCTEFKKSLYCLNAKLA